MIISILAAGTRGDVQPCAALAVALTARAHEVRLTAEQEFAGLVDGTAVAFKPIPGNIRTELEGPEGRAFFEGGGNPFSFLRWFIGIAKRYARETTPLARDYVAGSDVIVGTGLMVSFANAIALHFKIPCVYAYMQPSIP